MTTSTPAQGMRIFKALLLARLIAMSGTAAIFFTLVFWLYLTTQSVTTLALAYLCITVPGLIMMSPARAIVQRWKPRWPLIVGNGGAALALLILLVPAEMNQLSPWHVYLMIVVRVIFISLDWPAYTSTIKALVPQEQHAYAQRLITTADGLPDILGPFTAGILLSTVGLSSVIWLNIVMFLYYLGFLIFTQLPAPPDTADQSDSQPAPFDEIRQGWRYIISQPGLLALLIFFAITNFSMGMVLILIIPFGLTLASPILFGATLSLACLGPVAGMLIYSRWGPPRRLVQVIMGCTLLQGLLLLLGSLRPSLWLIGTATFIFLACFPIVLGSSQAIWERKVPADLHRRSLAVRRVIAWSTMPIAEILVGPLVDNLFGPLLAPQGALASSFGQLIGTGPGRGIGAVFTALGTLTILAVFVGYAYPRLRLIEDEMPDVDDEEKVVEAQLGVVNAF